VNDALVQLRQQFRVANPDDVRLVSWEAVDFPNGCLGLTIRDTFCTQVITPGYRMILDVRNRGAFEYRVNADGTLLLPAAAPPTGIENPVLIWEGRSAADGICRTLALAPNGEAFAGLCGSTQVPLRLFAENGHLDQMRYFASRFASFSAETAAGRVQLFGSGTEQANPTWQRAVGEWARLVQGVLRAGRVGPTVGAALEWQSPVTSGQGCRSLRVDVFGRAYAGVGPCGAIDPQALPGYWLTTDDLTRLYGWIDRFEPVNRQEQGTRLVLRTNGTQPFSGAELVSVYTWSEATYNRLRGQ
jgi:hypothetical protein